jgi:hypothetical protein
MITVPQGRELGSSKDFDQDTLRIAAEMTGRHCYAIEIDPAYVDVAVQRWQAFTGQEARLEGSDSSFAEVAAERQGKSES